MLYKRTMTRFIMVIGQKHSSFLTGRAESRRLGIRTPTGPRPHIGSSAPGSLSNGAELMASPQVSVLRIRCLQIPAGITVVIGQKSARRYDGKHLF